MIFLGGDTTIAHDTCHAPYCLAMNGAGNDFDASLDLDSPLKSVSSDQPPGRKHPYRNRNGSLGVSDERLATQADRLTGEIGGTDF